MNKLALILCIFLFGCKKETPVTATARIEIFCHVTADPDSLSCIKMIWQGDVKIKDSFCRTMLIKPKSGLVTINGDSVYNAKNCFLNNWNQPGEPYHTVYFVVKRDGETIPINDLGDNYIVNYKVN